MTIAGLSLAGAAVVASVTLSDRPTGRQAHPPADSVPSTAHRTPVDTLAARDSTPPATPAGKSAGAPPRDRSRESSVAAQPVDPGEPSAEPLQGVVTAPVVIKREGPRDSFAIVDGTPRDRTVPPAFPR
jgi:hypothetical protein